MMEPSAEAFLPTIRSEQAAARSGVSAASVSAQAPRIAYFLIGLKY